MIGLEHLEIMWIQQELLRDHIYFFPSNASHFNFKLGIILLLPSFHGLDLENTYLYLREFKEVWNTYNDLNCSMNKLKIFSFSLKDKAKT